MTEDVFKDPMQELVDKYAGEAEQRDEEAHMKEQLAKEKALNATRAAEAAKAKAKADKEKEQAAKNKTREVLEK